MKRKNRELFNSQGGFSLIEVIASLVIITIILVSFFGLLIQSNKTGKSSEQIIDATYLAQKEMEKMYNYFKSTKIETWESGFPYVNEKDEEKSSGNTTQYKVTPVNAKHKEIIIVKAEDMSPDNTVRITIEVYDSRGKILKAKVQNIFSL
ncbi:prepilin-type N-terminal cleavage/methylation domain-containing protein [Lysinibacillus xylanilyticus]|uniref:type IV pilus modification PilV family protein n=1 Tax=Lysinibacillus xylanilyticus TaxID=582475 RepID=UPI002B2517FC|nr:prepilin-type N-terminal cleavage/methylation domain-containing protein [Lysinibacillus xylanilyticus]MEB2278414.1 prepilin-type N-terminal cleavage/methylation domain-containing protein [Lysinibacillus xylanilyticus]